MNSHFGLYFPVGLIVSVHFMATASATVVLSDSFSRTPAATPVGTPPTRDTSASAQADASANWVSSWGSNNNAFGGYVTQNYTTYLEGSGKVYKVDGANGISGNWLNNGSAVHPLKLAGSATTITEPIGIPGFAWVQINHDFSADSVVTGPGKKMTISFDLYRTPGGNVSWFFGQSDPTGVANGNAGSPATIGANDISLYFRGTQAASFGLRDNGIVPAAVPGIANYDTISYTSGTDLSTLPIPISIVITGTNFSFGASSTIDLWVAGVQQDLNGSAAGTGYSFTWDNGGAAYMGFGSNNTPVEGTVGAPVYRASGIDNLVISVVPEPSSCLLVFAFLAGSAVALCSRCR